MVMSQAKYKDAIGQNFVPLFHKIPRWAYTLAKRVGVFRLVGFFLAFTWLRAHKPPRPRTMTEVGCLFYLDFLQVPPQNYEVVSVTPTKLVTRCDNPCPILDFAQAIHVDTLDMCRTISEPMSKWFVRLVDNRLEFTRNYHMIRPHSPKCEETISKRATSGR